MENTIHIDNEVQIGGTNDQLNNTIPTATKIIDLGFCEEDSNM